MPPLGPRWNPVATILIKTSTINKAHITSILISFHWRRAGEIPLFDPPTPPFSNLFHSQVPVIPQWRGIQTLQNIQEPPEISRRHATKLSPVRPSAQDLCTPGLVYFAFYYIYCIQWLGSHNSPQSLGTKQNADGCHRRKTNEHNY